MTDDPHDPMLGGYTPSKDKYPVERHDQHWYDNNMPSRWWIVPAAVIGIILWAIILAVVVAVYT